MKADQFIESVPHFIFEIIDFFNKRGLEFTVVGGVPRDFLLSGVIGKDWDVEISSQGLSFSISFWKDLAKELRGFGQVSNLSYQVIRLQKNDYEFEFSPPRIEVFSGDDHHKNFEAEFDFKLPPQESWKRRDFTLNAIGFKIAQDQLSVIDPFDGVRMLHQKVLHPCSADFVRDPVRYLRAYRFRQKLGFHFSETLINDLAVMPQNFSAHYLFSEMKKSKAPLKFYQSLINAGCKTLPVSDLKILSDDFEKSLIEEMNLYSWVMSLEINNLNTLDFCNYFTLSTPITKKIISFSRLSCELLKIDVEFLKKDFEEVKESSELHTVFSWYYAALQLISKNETCFISEFIKMTLNEWYYLLSFEPLKDVKHIDPPLRAKYVVWNLCQRI